MTHQPTELENIEHEKKVKQYMVLKEQVKAKLIAGQVLTAEEADFLLNG